MADFPVQVKVDEAQIARLTTVYKKAYAQIVKEIEGATNFGVANRKVILAQIQNILEDLGTNVGKFIEEELPQYYKIGAEHAVSQLQEIGADLKLAEGFNRVNNNAISAIVSDTADAFGESLTGVNRSARALMSKATKEAITQQIATGQIQGTPNKAIGTAVKAALREQGLDALKDKAGRGWTLDRYSEMLIRTKAVEARNQGMHDRMLQNGYDLVEVSSHGADDVCGDWEGEILSLTGETPGYPTLKEAEEDGLFHPNCKHAINVINPELASKTHAYDSTTGKYSDPDE